MESCLFRDVSSTGSFPFCFPELMQPGQILRLPNSTRQSAQRNRPHSSQGTNACFLGWKKQLDSPSTADSVFVAVPFLKYAGKMRTLIMLPQPEHSRNSGEFRC